LKLENRFINMSWGRYSSGIWREDKYQRNWDF